MSTSPPLQAQPLVVPQLPKNEVVVISHSTLFYWWPVWAVGYVMALITLFQDERMVNVPPDTKLFHKATGSLKYYETLAGGGPQQELNIQDREVLVAPPNKAVPDPLALLHMTASNNLGVIYAIVLLLVITITNVPMRGLWSVIAIIVIVLMSIIFALLHVWESIVTALNFLDIRINLAGYLFISTTLLIIWLIVFFLFDRQIYMIFSPGNLRVQLEIGDGETTYDTAGMTVQKQRSDLFRHWMLGLGSGDLLVTTAGAQVHHFDLPNVLGIGRKVRAIEELLRTRQVVEEAPRQH
jgi:hypothetical protein